jgi:hypothetical protein
LAVDTLGHPLALHTSAADEQDRAHVAPLVEQVQDVTGGNVEVAYVDQGYSGDDAANTAAADVYKRACNSLSVNGFPAAPGRQFEMCVME